MYEKVYINIYIYIYIYIYICVYTYKPPALSLGCPIKYHVSYFIVWLQLVGSLKL